jgi:hypothetical protein
MNCPRASWRGSLYGPLMVIAAVGLQVQERRCQRGGGSLKLRRCSSGLPAWRQYEIGEHVGHAVVFKFLLAFLWGGGHSNVAPETGALLAGPRLAFTHSSLSLSQSTFINALHACTLTLQAV